MEEEKELLNDDSNIEKEIEINTNTKLIAILAYLGILSLIPYYGVKDDEFINYHAKEGMNLLLVWLIYYVLYNVLSQIKVNTSCMYGLIVCKVTPWYIKSFLLILGLIVFVIAMIGILNVIRGEKNKLPFIRKLRVFK